MVLGRMNECIRLMERCVPGDIPLVNPYMWYKHTDTKTFLSFVSFFSKKSSLESRVTSPTLDSALGWGETPVKADGAPASYSQVQLPPRVSPISPHEWALGTADAAHMGHTLLSQWTYERHSQRFEVGAVFGDTLRQTIDLGALSWRPTTQQQIIVFLMLFYCFVAARVL